MKHYLDYNATAPVRPEVAAVMHALQSMPLNASSVHAAGRKAKSIIEDARRDIAQIIGAFANEVVFTASGTEANNWVLRTFPDYQIIISAIEHSSVYKTAARPSVIPVKADGVVDMDVLEKLLPQDGAFLVSVMLANNETGVIQPIRAIADKVRSRGGLLHCDAVQALGKIPVNYSDLGCDLMTISAHKMGGPVGAAALIIKNNLALKPFITGGGQELNRRAGTENVAAIAGFAKACEVIDLTHMQKLKSWLSSLEKELEEKGAKVIGAGSERLPNTSCIMMPNVSAETQLISFDLEGIAVSAGSACSSGRIEPSHVLKAMGISQEPAATAIRISGGWGTSQEDVVVVLKAWEKLYRHKHAL